MAIVRDDWAYTILAAESTPAATSRTGDHRRVNLGSGGEKLCYCGKRAVNLAYDTLTEFAGDEQSR